MPVKGVVAVIPTAPSDELGHPDLNETHVNIQMSSTPCFAVPPFNGDSGDAFNLAHEVRCQTIPVPDPTYDRVAQSLTERRIETCPSG